MSSHNDHDQHSHEAKPVAFRTPLILALVTVLIILLAVSTCDKKHGCCEDEEKCEAACDPKHGEHCATEAHGTEHATETVPAAAAQDHTAVSDTTHHAVSDTAAVKTEEHGHH